MDIEGIELTERQRSIYKHCLLTSPTNYIIVSTGRQIGKTTLDIQVALDWTINNDDFNCGFFMPTYKQCKKVFKSIEKGLKGLPSKYIEFNRTDLTISFANGSMITFFTSENDNCRGNTFDGIIVDEACFIKSEIFTAAILPTILVAISRGNGKCLVTSTPKFKNWFFDYFITTKLKNKVAIKFTTEQGGLIQRADLLQIKSTTPETIYKNEYMAEFVEDGAGLFQYTQCMESFDYAKQSKKGCTASVDWGVEDDYTVLTVMNNEGRVVLIKRWRQIDWTIIVKEIAPILKEHNARCWAETNGIGNMPTKELRKLHPLTFDWYMSAKNKTDIVNHLSSCFHNKQIIINSEDEFLHNELDAFTMEYDSKSGKVSYGARNGFHDDSVISLAICNWNRTNAVTNVKDVFRVGK